MFVITKPTDPKMMLARYALAQVWTKDIKNAQTFTTREDAQLVKIDTEEIKEIK